MELFAGIDIGTSSVRITAINRQGEIFAETRSDLPAPLSVAEGCFEQSPALWLDACLKCLTELSQLLKGHLLKAIAIDGTSGTTLLVDNNNQAVGNALMYNDNRSAQVIDNLGHFIPDGHLTRSASSSLAKALFLLSEQSDNEALNIMHQADWITSQLSAKASLSDENNCLKLGYDSINQCWPEWLKKAPFKLYKKLPKVLRPGTAIALMHNSLASKLGFKTAPMIIAGTTDSTASTLATGISRPGEAVTTLGTTMVMKVISESPVFSAPHGIYSHRLMNGQWLVGGASNSGGNVLEKYFAMAEIQKLSEMIDPSQPTGLDYYPLSSKGERFPINDIDLMPRLTPRPEQKSVFLQAIFEGFANVEKLAYQLIAKMGAPSPLHIISAGGKAAENKILTEIRQNILGINIEKAQHTEASYGVAQLALSANKKLLAE